ncbi:PRC-barrel domain-containing protein [Evansella sp. AB-rgal1]|uniref:PRC-barrel domain-containing protein n=1 Tax=Evansella sp. AB-rgal1 TaxID=3242696 RepID=UPI00359D34A1
MRTFQKVKGAPIFFNQNKERVGIVSDLVLSYKKEKVKGYWIQTGRWWSKKHFLPIEDIVHVDGDGMYVNNNINLKPIAKKDKRLCEGRDHIIGKPLRKKDGATIGLIEDVYFLPDTGMIVGYELTEGLFSDLQDGVRVVKSKTPLLYENNYFVMSSES